MTRIGDGHINAGRADRSPRLMRIVEILKEADHPLSAQEIAVQAYDFQRTGKVMLNVSTNIGELRADVNREAGYIVSFSTSWRQVVIGQRPGKRVNEDNSITYFIAHASQHWQDGRPRYWLIAAPGWIPTWSISPSGEQVFVAGRSAPDARKLYCTEQWPKKPGSPMSESPVVRYCKNPACGKVLPDDGWHTCDQTCNQAWKDSLQPALTVKRSQGSLF